MINGLDVFRAKFKEYKNEYVMIGGIACSLLMNEAALDFRATKDFDIVFITDSINPDFIRDFWDFIKEGGYKNKQRSDGSPQFYRFEKPTNPAYPHMLEIFSVSRDIFADRQSQFIKIKIAESISSLSAILLDKDYYSLLFLGKKSLSNIQLLSAEYLIPFKIKAWLDLASKRARGEQIDSKQIKKHRNDVFRLFHLLAASTKVTLPQAIRADVDSFLRQMESEQIDLTDYGIKADKTTVIEQLSKIYL